MVSLTEVENSVPFNKDEIDSPVKYITLADAEKIRPMPFDYKRGTFERFQSGIISGIESIKDIPQQIEIFGNEVSYTLSGFGGDKEEINRKKSNLDTAIRNFEEVQKERNRYSSRAEQESLAFGVGAGVPSYAIALTGGYVGGSVAAVLGATEKGITAAATATGLVSMAPQQFGSEVQQKLPRTEEGEIDYQKITPEWAMKAEGGAVVATAVNLVLEKKLGFGEQIKIWRMPIKFGKSTTTNIVRGLAKGGVTAVSEGMTEGLQDLASYGVSLIDGTATISELPEQLQQSLKSAIIGGILGGTVGTSVAIHEGYNFRKQMRDMIAPVVQDVKKAEQIADAIYNSANDTMTNVISKELELDSQLKARRGNVYNSMLKAVSKAIDKSGGYTGLTEEQKAQHATEVSNMFADQVLVEANKRGVLIEDVIDYKDIKYENDEIHLKSLTEEEIKVKERKRKKKSREEVKPQEEDLKTQIEENAPAEEKEENLNDIVSSYEGAENFDVEAMPTEEKQAVFEAEQQVNDAFVPTEETTEQAEQAEEQTTEIAQEEAETEEKEFGDEFPELQSIAEDEAIKIDNEFGRLNESIDFSDLADFINQPYKMSMSEAILSIIPENFTKYDYEQKRSMLEELGKRLFWEPGKVANYDELAYEEYIKRVFDRWYNTDEAQKQVQIELSVQTADAIQEDTLPEVEKEDTTTPDKIEDFGEYLYGARKDLWTGFKEKINKELPENDEDIKLSEAFPEPNYEKLIANGVDVNALATIKAIRDIIPTKPKNTYSYRFREWAKTVRVFRALTSKIIEGNFSLDVADTLIPEVLKNQVQLYRMLGYPYFTKAKGYTLKPMYYHNYGGDDWVMTNIYHEGDKEGYEVEYNNRNVRVNGSYFFENINDGIDEIKSRIDIDLAKGKSKDKTVKFDIYYNTMERGKIFLGKKIRSGKYVDLRTFGSIKEAREYLANNYDTLVEELNKLKQNPMTRGEVNEARVGENYRKGANATPEMFADTFGFRGVQFGNWVEQKKRINDLNEAYDALIDLSKVFGVPTRAIALNGTLGLAFGARGRGGFGDVAAAHYEPDTVVINLTKKYGAGSLAHEWFHALDNSFMKKDNKQLGYISEMALENNPLSHNRPEVMIAFYNLRNALENSKLFERSKEWDKARSDDYWSTIRELGARTFEQYIKDKLKGYEVQNDFLVNILESKDSVYLNPEEKAPIYEAYDKLFNTLKTRETEKGVEFYQGEKIKRGSYNEKSKVIKLFKDANTSTLPHELAHYWLDNMYSYVRSGAASVDYLNQFKAVKDFLGIKDNQEFLTRKQQEKFASGYEKYIHRGIIPNSIIGNVYDGYERWLRDVYDSIEDIKAQGKLPFKLTPEIIKFFDSMLTGGLGEVASQNIADTARLEEMKESDDAVVKESKQAIEAKPIRPTSELLPVKSEGEERKSRLYERMKDLGDAEDSLGYNEVTIEEQREKAQKLWQNNPEQAQSILNDVNFSNDILRNAVYTEQQRLALENGDSDTFLESLRKQSAEATRIGQELSALRGVFDDITMPSYWIRQAENEAHKQLAKKMTSYLDRLAGKTSLESLTKQLDDDINSLTKEMLASDDKVKTLSEGIKELKEKYKGLDQKDVELYQEEFTNEEEARKYVEKKAKEAIGLYLTDEQANNIIQMASNLDKMSGKFDKFGVPSEKFFAEKAKLEKAVNEHTPTSQVKVLISTIGRANMLTAPATSVLNVVSNLENYAIQKMLRYINNNVTNHTNDNIVDSDLAEEYRKKLWSTFWNTGYDASAMRSLTDTKLYKGESVTHSEGDGAIREIGRFAEKYVFSRLISSPDIYFKSMRGFTDYIGNEATDIAYKEGLTGEKAKKRANDLFLDATRIEPQTEEGKLIRQKAQTEAAVITYQQDTELSKNLLKLRDLINKGTGDIGIGDILSPFVKTPANILSMGYDATVGAFGHPKNLIQALNDLRSGNLQSDALQTAIRQTTNQVLAGVLISVILSTLIDDDDYIPDYSQLSQRERNAVREAGGTFGSVKIGNTYISTDFFGPLEMPLVAWLNARREKGLTEKASAFGGAVIREFLDAPVIRDTISSSKSLENIGSGHLELEEALYNYLGDTISSRLTPNLLNVFAKITDDYERKAGKSIIDKLKARTPILREQLPAQVSMATGKPIETQSAWLQILFGARAKEERNSVLAKEFMRLSKTGNGASISDPTKYGDLRTLPDDMKPRVLQDFSAMYSKEANRIIKLASYRKASDDDKKSMLDKARRKVTKEIKQKYKKYLKKKK